MQYLFLNFHTGSSADPLFVSLNIPAAFSSRAQVVLAAAFLACSAFGLSRLVSQAGFRRLIPSLTLFSTQCVWFLLPTLLSLGERFQVPQSRYSTGVLAVMHSAQYLWITSYYAKREAVAGEGRPWRPLAYFTILVVGGIALFIPGPWLSSRVFHLDFTRSFLLFTALINIHHFILDGAIWKLRDGRIAALLVNSRTHITESAMEARDRTLTALRWLASTNSIARSLRVAAAVALLAWGGVDQVHYYWALQSGNLDDLKRAAALAPYDTPLQMRLARRAMEEGAPQDSVAAWRYAVKADPADPGPRDAWLKYLTQEKRLDEAYQLTGSWLKLAPRDAALLVNHGILAQQFGQVDEAELSWQRALVVDPSQADADLYLASALEKQGKLEAAIGHYETYLAKMAQQPASSLPPPANLISVALKVADCNVRAGHSDAALQFYKMARTLAALRRRKRNSRASPTWLRLHSMPSSAKRPRRCRSIRGHCSSMPDSTITTARQWIGTCTRRSCATLDCPHGWHTQVCSNRRPYSLLIPALGLGLRQPSLARIGAATGLCRPPPSDAIPSRCGRKPSSSKCRRGRPRPCHGEAATTLHIPIVVIPSDSEGSAVSSWSLLAGGRPRHTLMLVSVFFNHRNHAAVRHFADHVLELDGGVVDVEVLAQHLFHIAQNAFTDRRRNIGDGDMAGERSRFRSDAPHVQIVNIIHALNPAHRGFHPLQLDATRRAFQQDVQGFTNDAKA